ncbi:ATP-binding protein [Massilia sp. UYP11]|uniref:hybrid sensor histidine kinase/response regulator n=1 Tax=Massilia sp. UYP11 TaxID=1756385 RepID=UPI003D24BCE1
MLILEAHEGGRRHYCSSPDGELREAILALDARTAGDVDLADGALHELGLAPHGVVRTFRKVTRSAAGPQGRVSCVLATAGRTARMPAPGVVDGLRLAADLLLAAVCGDACRDAPQAQPDGASGRQARRREPQLRMQAEMLDNATEAIVVRDMDNRVLYWNQAAVRRYGWSGDEVLDRPVSQTLYACCPAGEFERAMRILGQRGVFSGRLPHATLDGRVLTMHVHWILVRHDDGAPRAILSVSCDPSERLAPEQRARQTEKLEALGRLTGGIAHDFNNWLTVIIGNADELANALADDEELGEVARMLQLAGERGTQLTRRLLAFAGRQALAPEVVVVGEVVDALRPLIARALNDSIDVRLINTGAQWRTCVDRGQLEAAILNVVLNAGDAMPGGGRVTILLTLAEAGAADDAGLDLEPGEYVVIAIADDGHGMAREVIDRAFEPFFTTRSESSRSGLGLSTVYGFARQSRGDVTIDSTDGVGTIVKLYLPLSGMSAQAPAASGGALPALRGCAVLLVDDDATVLQLVLGQLRELGCDVTWACDAGQALAHLAGAGRVDVLFSDVVMPGMSGIELARRARTLRPRLRILLASGHTVEAMGRDGELDADVRLLNKPYGKSMLARALAEVLDDTGGTT